MVFGNSSERMVKNVIKCALYLPRDVDVIVAAGCVQAPKQKRDSLPATGHS